MSTKRKRKEVNGSKPVTSHSALKRNGWVKYKLSNDLIKRMKQISLNKFGHNLVDTAINDDRDTPSKSRFMGHYKNDAELPNSCPRYRTLSKLLLEIAADILKQHSCNHLVAKDIAYSIIHSIGEKNGKNQAEHMDMLIKSK